MADKKKKEKSVLDIAREMESKQQKLLEEQKELARQKQEEERKTYEEQLRQERLELIRLKQGVIEESETIHEEQPEEKHYTFWQKIGNFLYHSKWWLGLAVFFVALTGFLVWDTVMTVRPDLIILLLVDDDDLNASCNAGISELFEQYIEDKNGDGKTRVDVYYIPVSEKSAQTDAYSGNMSKLGAMFQVADAVLVISNEEADNYFAPDRALYDLEEDFGQYAETDGFRFYLSGTDFAEDIGWTDEPLDEDIYIGIRSVRKTMDSEEKMQEVFDFCYPVLRQFIEEYGDLQ